MFEERIEYLKIKIKSEVRKIILLMHNVIYHILANSMNNVDAQFLPPNLAVHFNHLFKI